MYKLFWKGEEIDSFDTLKEAQEMAREYSLAYGSMVTVKGPK